MMWTPLIVKIQLMRNQNLQIMKTPILLVMIKTLMNPVNRTILSCDTYL